VKPRNIDEHDVVGARLEIEAEVAKGDWAREVPLPSKLKYAIRAHTDSDAPDAPVVGVTTRTVERWVTRAAERCQAETENNRWAHLGPHDLRRTWGTQLVEQEVEPGLIMEWGGWQDWDTFREHYLGAYSPEMEQKQIEKVRWL